MRQHNAAYAAYQFSASVEPRYVFRVEFSDSSADDMYVRSHGDIDLAGVQGSVLTNARLSSIAVTSQSLDIQNGVSSIGKMNFSGVDVNRELTDHQRAQFNENHTARYRNVEFYKGFKQLQFSEYELQATQILQGTTYRGGTYQFRCRDIQRAVREDIFEPIELTLAQPVEDETDTVIEIVSRTDAQGRQLSGFLHDTGFTDRPGEKVAYVKIDDEIISVLHSDIQPNQLVNVTRGALGTRAEAHTSGETGKKVEEYIYLEGAFPRVAYGILTGFWLGQSIFEQLPSHWSAGIPGQFVRTSDFLTIGDDWITDDPAQGLPVQINSPGKTDAKRYVEREIMRIFSAFMPVYNDGALGLKRNQPVLSTAAPIGTINDSHLKQGFTPTVTYAYDKIVNDLEIKYSEVDGELRRTVPLQDLESQAAHKKTPTVTFEAAALSGSRYSPVALAEIIKRYRDRYAYAPIETTAEVLANGASYEIGDVVRLQTQALVLFTNDPKNGGIEHSFEVQSVSHNVSSGTVVYRLFGTSREAGDIQPNFTNFAIPDELYPHGQNIASVPGVTDTAAAYVLGNGLVLTGTYWADKDIEIPSGNTVFYNDTTQLWIRGVVSCFGKLDGKGRGLAGSASFVDLSSIPIVDNDDFKVFANPPATTAGIPGFLGTTQADGGIIEFADRISGSSSRYDYFGQSVISTITEGQYNEMPSFYVRVEGGEVVGLPGDLRGTSGGGGGYRAWREDQSNIREDNFGGAGGAGGASLVCICRGFTFGAGGELDCSGADGQPGTIDFSNEVPAYSGGGAGGAPGGVLIALDGSLSPIPQKFGHVTADYGDSPNSPGNVLDNAIVELEDTRFGPDTVERARVRENRASFFESGSQNVQLGGAAFRSVFVVPELALLGEGTDEELLRQQEITLTITEAYDQREDARVTLIQVEVNRVSVSNVYSAAKIFYRLKGTTNWNPVDFAEDVVTFDLPANGQEYEIQARPVLINGEVSLDGAVVQSFVTDSNRPSAIPNGLTAQPLPQAVALKARVPRTLGKPDYVNIYRSQTANDPTPDFIERAPVFFITAPENAWCTTDLVDSSVTGGEQYYYWVTSVNEQGETARFPTGNGIGVVPAVSADGQPGADGEDGLDGADGLDAIPRNTRAGEGQADLTLVINRVSDGTADPGELQMLGTRYEALLLNGTTQGVNQGGGASTFGTPWEGPFEPFDERGFVMWGNANIGTSVGRFPGISYPNVQPYNIGFWLGEYDTTSRQWYAVDNSGNRQPVTLDPEDRILFTIFKELGETEITGSISHVTPLLRDGIDAIPRNTRFGEGTSDLNIAINFTANATADLGEISLVGTTYNANLLNGTIQTVTLPGAARTLFTPWENSYVPFDFRGFIMWSPTNAVGRFPGVNYPNQSPYNAGFWLGEYDTFSRQWYAVDNNESRQPITLSLEDRILFAIYKDEGATQITGALRYVTPIPKDGVDGAPGAPGANGDDGADAFPPGARVGDGAFTMPLAINTNAGGAFDAGEIRFQPGNYRVRNNQGIFVNRTLTSNVTLLTPWEGGYVPIGGKGYIMWFQGNAASTFSNLNYSQAAPYAIGFFTAEYSGNGTLWYAVNNTGTRQGFNINDAYVIVATAHKPAGTTQIQSLSVHATPAEDGDPGEDGFDGDDGDSFTGTLDGPEAVQVLKIATGDPSPNDFDYEVLGNGNDGLIGTRIFRIFKNAVLLDFKGITFEFDDDTDTWSAIDDDRTGIAYSTSGMGTGFAKITLSHAESGLIRVIDLTFITPQVSGK